MNERQAQEQGLHFTGHYSSDKDEVKRCIAEDRVKYPKARIVLVNVPHSKLSRSGPGMGYSAYADDKYSAYRTLERLGNVDQNHNVRLLQLKVAYEKRLEEENARYDREINNACEARATLNS
jgi:hypothetical protein